MATAAARRAYVGPALFSFGFRPFFLFGAAWSALVAPLWMWSFLGGPVEGLTREWHIHEMLFGFLAAVVAGFLTTAVPNWTGRMPVIGAPLGGLFALWAAGRLAMIFHEALGPVAALVDCAFLVTFAAVIWREVIAGKNWRNLLVCGLISLLALANIAFHLDAAFLGIDLGMRLGLSAAAILISLIGGRIVPSFTRNWMKARGIEPQSAVFGLPDRAALTLTVAGAGLWVIQPEARISGAALILAGLANVVRLARWRGWRTGREPLVWILHLGYGWLAMGLLALGAAVLVPEIVPRTAGVHALTAGAVGVMTLAVMTRASRGHTGRGLAADASTTAIYLAINAAALLRLVSPFAGALQPALLVTATVAWSAAFGGFALAYARMLTTPRPARV